MSVLSKRIGDLGVCFLTAPTVSPVILTAT